MATARRSVPIDHRNAPYSAMTPLVKTVKHADGSRPRAELVWDINDGSNFHAPAFSVANGRRSSVFSIEPNPTVMVENFFPDKLLEDIAAKTMGYAAGLLPPSRRRKITPSHVSYFLAMYYYMGVVKLPSKRDYWRRDDDFWPVHKPAQNISRDMFGYLWRYLHLAGPDKCKYLHK